MHETAVERCIAMDNIAEKEHPSDMDTSVISEIIQANEIIEENNSEDLHADHRALFSDLYDQLTGKEGDALFDMFKEIKAPIDTTIHRQGESNNGLYFVNRGKLRIAIRHGERNIFVKILYPGDIFGSETFFSSSNCTASVITFVSTNLYRLDKDDFMDLKMRHPGLEAKLNSYCVHVGTISDHVQHKKMDRRQKTRIRISGKATIQFLSGSDNLIGKPLRVGLADISRGGTSFSIRLSNEEKVDLMLGRRLVVQYSSATVAPTRKIQSKGTIVAINPNESNGYLFHLKFDRDLTNSNFAAIVSTFSKTA